MLPVTAEGGASIWAFPINTSVHQIVMMEKINAENGRWHIFWVDIDAKDFLKNSDGEYITPEGDVLSNEILSGTSAYLGLPDDISPQEGFRVQKHEGKLYLLNRTKTVRLLSQRAPGNSLHVNKQMIYFVALTSGADVQVNMKWQKAGVEVTSNLTVSGASIETIAQALFSQWTTLPDGVRIASYLRQVALITFTPDVTDFELEATNVIALAFQGDTGEGESTPLLSLNARPPTAPEGWRLKVIGDPLSDLDDLYLTFRAQEFDS